MRLIDADALEQYIKEPSIYDINETDFLSIVAEQPTVDATPVRHGKWVLNNCGYHRCSECDGQAGFEDWMNGRWELPEWCFYCGSKNGLKRGVT